VGAGAYPQLRGSRGRESWLLIKRRDGFASRKDITAAERFSVVSKRTLAQIANDEGKNVESAATGDPQHAVKTK
jgi:hypothetical protein